MARLFFLFNKPTLKDMLGPSVFGGLVSISAGALAAADIQFNTDILDLNDRTTIELSQFSRSGFILPGTYPMTVQVNNQALPEQPVAFYPPEDNPKGSQACVSSDLVTQLGLKKDSDTHLT